MLTFSKALPVFVSLFVALGFTLGALESKKVRPLEEKLKLSSFANYITKILFSVTTTLLLYVLIRAQLQGVLYKISTEYITLTTISLLLILFYTIKTRASSHALFLLLLFSAVLFLSHIRINDLFFTERSRALYAIIEYHHWDIHWHYINLFYNPLPIDLTLMTFIHYVLGLDFVKDSGLRLLIFNTALVLALTLNVLILLKLFVRRRHVENLASVIIALVIIFLTPYLNPTCHSAKYLASLSVMMLTYFIGRSIMDNTKDFFFYVLITILITHAIFTHGSGFIILILLTTLLITYLIPAFRPENVSLSFKVIRNIMIITLIILILKVIYTYGVLGVIEQGLPSLKELFVRLIFSLAKGVPQTPHRSLYNVFVEPYYAASWALMPGLAAGLVISMLLDRNERTKPRSMLALVLWLTGSITMGLGYLFYYSGGPYATLYPACLLLTPLIALRLGRSKLSLIVCALILVSIAPVALKDPMLNPAVYRVLNPMDAPAYTLDYIEAKFLAFHTVSSPDFKYWFLEYRLGAVVSTLTEIYNIKGVPRSVGSTLLWQLYEELQFNHTIEPGILYAFRRGLLESVLSKGIPANVLYSSERTLVLYRK